MTPLFGEPRTLEEPIPSELLMHAAAPRPFADAASFIALAARTPLADWRDVVLPRFCALRRTPEYQAARIALVDACDTMGYPTARDLLVRRAREVSRSIAWFAPHARQTALDPQAAGKAFTAAALAVWAREQLTSERFAALLAPFEALTPIASP